MHVDEAPVTEVAVAPHPVEQRLAAEHPAGARCQLAQQPELGLREVHLLLLAAARALVRDDLEVTEAQARVPRLRTAGPAQQRPDPGGELLRRERLGEVVVGTRLEPRHDVVGVGTGSDHHDRHVARLAQRTAQLEAVDAREHDVDQDDVGRLTVRRRSSASSPLSGLLDGPTLVLERHLDGSADAFVVLDGQDPSTHSTMVPHDPP